MSATPYSFAQESPNIATNQIVRNICPITKHTKTAIVDDFSLLAYSIRDRLNIQKDFPPFYMASNGKDALQALTELKSKAALPNVILMGIEMPEMDGIKATREIHLEFPEVKIIMLTVFGEDERIFQAIQAGAAGYLIKDEKIEIIISSIHEVLEGGAPMSAPIANRALKLLRQASIPQLEEKTTPVSKYHLTKREIEILEMVVQGLTYRQIAAQVFLSPKTVRNHIANIYSKLQVHSKTQAMQKAQKTDGFKAINLKPIASSVRQNNALAFQDNNTGALRHQNWKH